LYSQQSLKTIASNLFCLWLSLAPAHRTPNHTRRLKYFPVNDFLEEI
jgi:hypothetical protein